MIVFKKKEELADYGGLVSDYYRKAEKAAIISMPRTRK